MRRDTVRKLYQDAMLQVFGVGNKEFDNDLKEALVTDIHYGDQSPDQWSPDSVLEVYCENGIPNATDISVLSWQCSSGKVSHNCEKWYMVDDLVNLMLEAMERPERYRHEPYNSTVVNIYAQ